MKKNITIDDLAGMVQRGFFGVDKRFNEVDKRFNEVDKRFNEVDKRFDILETEMNARFDQLEKIILHEYRERIERLEDQIKELQTDFRQLAGFKK